MVNHKSKLDHRERQARLLQLRDIFESAIFCSQPIFAVFGLQ